MRDYIFGLKVLPSNGAAGADFIIHQVAGVAADTQYNPYGTSYFNDPQYMTSAGGEKITSIPSPYARMHITDIAFREYVAGKGIMTETQLRQRAISEDYVRAMSHCLDIFEMMFRLSDLDLLDHNITITLNNLVNPNTPGVGDAERGNPNLRKYLETLQLFRNAYKNVIHSRVKPDKEYYYDFTTNYLFKYNGHTFGATSPFSGFFAKADCNLVNSKGEPELTFKTHNFLTANTKDYLLFNGRDQQFLDFLYLLLNDTGLCNIYHNLFEALKLHVDLTQLSTKRFDVTFPDFNFGPKAGELPQVVTSRGDTFVRPNNIDRCYLKYLLYVEKPFDFSVDIDEFSKPINERLSPDKSKSLPWLTVNDLLSDTLVVLPYEIDDKYEAIKYIDESTKLEHRCCLIPIKQEALNYVDLPSLINGLKIRKLANNHFCVMLTLKLTTGGCIELRRDYYTPTGEKGICCYPNGVIMQGVDMKQFVFGVYPFVVSKAFENIYKVMFYNDFSNPWNLKFFYEADGAVAPFPDEQVVTNVTNTIESGGNFFPHNCTYYEVSGGDLADNNSKVGIKFAELTISIPVLDKAGTAQVINGTALIVPKLKDQPTVDHNETVVAIDLGTSNTYMAYIHNNANASIQTTIQDFTTIHGQGTEQFVELEFMHKDRATKDLGPLAQFHQDAIIPDGTEAEALSAQLSEFIPARITNNGTGFSFPIPSVINRLRSVNGNTGMSPLINRSIPFAYYSIGWRRDDDRNMDIDNIAEGKFKWFFGKNKQGVYATDLQRKSDFVAFMSELLFIVRCNMLCNGYDLDRCKIIWTYPLSFQPPLVQNYTHEWEVNFCKYFHPEWLNTTKTDLAPDMTGPQAPIKNYIMSTNESLTPFFACCENPGAVHHLSLVIDMGGGSTDVIGYRNNQAEFITSFGFAGNSLYLDGNLNHENLKSEVNYMSYFVRVASETLKGQTSSLERTRKIDLNAPISSLMNYGFSQNPVDFGNIFLNSVPKFMLQLHNAALFYHIAQVSRALVPDEMPVSIFFTGNGSKLITMQNNFNTATKYLRKAFETVYATTAEAVKKMEVKPYPNPKAATVYGALEGYNNGALNFNQNARTNRVVAFGDDAVFEKIDPEDNGIPTQSIAGKEETVYENVKKFIDMFYSAYGNSTPVMSKDEMFECLDFIKDDPKNRVEGDTLSDSLFFQFVSLLMEQVSIRLLKRN